MRLVRPVGRLADRERRRPRSAELPTVSLRDLAARRLATEPGPV
jgi:hypothetical protein